MIRTRDLVIFLCALLLVLFGIALTLLSDTQKQRALTFFDFTTTQQEETEYVAQGPEDTINRQSIIERLRNALSQNQSDVEPSPSVEESEESVSDADVAVPAAKDIVYCTNYDDAGVISRNYPHSGVSLVIEDSKRQVVYTELFAASASTTASTSSSTAQTVPQTRSTVLLEMPAYPVVSGEACVQSEVIGVTVKGALLHNSEVPVYRGYGPEYLIGYAQDGFPVYGFYQGEVDSCGGYMHPSGYRYSITANRDYIVGCFKGTPSTFATF